MDVYVERLYAALTNAMRRGRARPFEGPVTVAEIYQDLVPYRVVRSAIGFELNADYEHALLQLLAGVDGLARLEPESAAAELRAELTTSNPNVGLFRKFAACEVWIAPPAEEAAHDIAPSRAAEHAEPTARPHPSAGSEGQGADLAGRQLDDATRNKRDDRMGAAQSWAATLEQHTPAEQVGDSNREPPAARAGERRAGEKQVGNADPEPPAAGTEKRRAGEQQIGVSTAEPQAASAGEERTAGKPSRGDAWETLAARAKEQRPTHDEAGPGEAERVAPAPVRAKERRDAAVRGADDRSAQQRSPLTRSDALDGGPGERAEPMLNVAGATGGLRDTIRRCGFCDEKLPAGRLVRFCPHCGGDQTRRPCVACGEALETEWRFCVTCGAPQGDGGAA